MNDLKTPLINQESNGRLKAELTRRESLLIELYRNPNFWHLKEMIVKELRCIEKQKREYILKI